MPITCEFYTEVLEIGTKVYIPRPAVKSVQEDEIRGYYCILTKDEDKLILQPTDYKLNTANLGRGTLSDAWKRNEFFLSYEDAMEANQVFPVTATEAEWLNAIGLRKDSPRLEYEDDCELAPCCALISDIRDLLHKACKEGQLTWIERRDLIQLMEKHDAPEGPTLSLDKILAQLKIAWTDDDESVKLLP